MKCATSSPAAATAAPDQSAPLWKGVPAHPESFDFLIIEPKTAQEHS